MIAWMTGVFAMCYLALPVASALIALPAACVPAVLAAIDLPALACAAVARAVLAAAAGKPVVAALIGLEPGSIEVPDGVVVVFSDITEERKRRKIKLKQQSNIYYLTAKMQRFIHRFNITTITR